VDDGILRCQVRVFAGGAYGSCGGEATHFAIVRPTSGLPGDDYAFLMCSNHASGVAEEIGLKPNHELRDHVRHLGARPAF
jgi:hypothetical protein